MDTPWRRGEIESMASTKQVTVELVFDIRIPEQVAEALKALGWTPPEEDDGKGPLEVRVCDDAKAQVIA